jgi:hypothetical protein
MHDDKSNSGLLARSTCTLLAVLSGGGCGQEALIGENAGGGEGAVSGQRGTGSIDWSEGDCYQRSELAALPATEATFSSRSPALWVESGRGSWRNAAGDTLEVVIDAPATRVAYVCDGETSREVTTGAESSVSFMLSGRVSLHTADGRWDETFDANFGLSVLGNEAAADLVLSARGELDLAMLHGSFRLPRLPKPPQPLVQLSLEYEDDSWILRRTVDVDRAKSGAHCDCPDDAAPAWAAQQLTFVRR